MGVGRGLPPHQRLPFSGGLAVRLPGYLRYLFDSKRWLPDDGFHGFVWILDGPADTLVLSLIVIRYYGSP